ncbi:MULTISPECIES: hypothetical protein [Chryseobacterium]|uniref:hypothetical protein n=1 Tax=Chryseobacterium TaxID=59732 RepID=UPI00195AAF35|nr:MULTISPECIES: hypothetical protein [Chryseobacterium]MBM7417722.1 hypothetical protein [Chryseobacterium sp. JUb44]MDH6211915.1 hypothetical protein [Chryseobacterium sp. BIGb0186]WSO10548.1 hypothetical protein VUJ64_01210 [Chryseobacterium scophthalmum]
MKKLILFFLLLSIFEVYSQQKLNWAEVVYGNIKGLKENKIKTLKLKQGNKVLRSIEVISDKSILVKDSLNTQYFDFDDENRLISVKSVKDMWQQQFNLNFKNYYVNQLSKTIDNNGIVTFSKFSKVSFNNALYEEREVYNFDRKKNDSLNVFRIKYFFNQQNPDLSYRETYNNGKIWNKKYFNQTEVTKEKFDGHFIVDSILQKDYKVTKYHFENYPEYQNIKIENDSVLTIHKKLRKKVSEKLEYASIPFREIFYDENETIKEKIIYKNYQNAFNEWVIWEEIKYDERGKVINRKFPNKSIYKLKNGILVYRKNIHRVRSYNMICSVKRNSSFNYLQSYSPSILFSIKWANNFTDNFDTYSVEDEEMIYGILDFNVNGATEIKDNYSASRDVKNELVRTSKSMTRNGRDLKYFKDLEVEAETISGKKYNINLIENTYLLSFPIHTFLTKENY